MSESILQKLNRNLHHTQDQIDLVTYLMPPKLSKNTVLISLLNSFLPFIKLREKTSHYLFAVSSGSGRAYALHVGEKAGELFDMKSFGLNEISGLNVESNPQKYAHKISFEHQGKQEKMTLLEYPLTYEWTDEEKAAFQPMAKTIVDLLTSSARSSAA